MRKKKKIMR